jgi:hypothetical protein
MVIIRRVGAVVLVLAAVAVWFLMEPEQPVAQAPEQVRDRGSDISQELSDYERNEARTAGAPQQTVVNGWAAKDLLAIIAEQQNEAFTRPEVRAPLTPNDERVPALVGLVVAGLALAVFTTPSRPTATTSSTEAGTTGAHELSGV